MKIKTKIFLTFFISGLILTIGGVYAHHIIAVDALKVEIYKNLTTATENKAKWVVSYIEEKKGDAAILSISPTIIHSLMADIDESGLRIELQKDTKEYLKKFKDFWGYSNILLIRSNGNILWAAEESEKNNINLENQKSQLSQVYKKVKDTGETLMSDFELQEGNNEPTAFVAAPVYEPGDKYFTGVVVFQINKDQINAIMEEGTSLGETGDVYLVGRDLMMRSDSLQSKENTILQQKVDTDNARNCFSMTSNPRKHIGHSPVGIFTNYRGLGVLGVHTDIPEMGWCLIAEITTKEALSPINEAMLFALILGAILIIIVFFVSSWASSTISRPINILQRGTEIIEQGNLNYKFKIKSKNEIGQLARAFNSMIYAIKKSRKNIETKVKKQTSEIQKQKQNLEKQQMAILNILEDVEEEMDNRTKEKEKLNTMLHSIGDGIFVIDKNLKIEVFNKVASQISGYDDKTAIGQKYNKILKFIDAKTGKSNDDFIQHAIASKTSQVMPENTILISKNGTKVPVADSAAPLKDKDGNVIGCIIIFRDITKELEIDKMKSEFVSIASHQLRTPLTGIKWFTQLLMQQKIGKLNKQQKDFLNQININNERIINLVEDLLDVSHIETGKKFTIIKKPTNIYSMVKEVIKSQNLGAKKKGITTKILSNFPKKLTLEVDEEKLYQVFNNLIDNAIKYSKKKSNVQVGFINKNKNETIIYVKDDGLGIPKHQQKRIFEKFFRADNAAKTESSGTGLGLYIIKAIVEAHQGKIWFESTINKGTTFYVSLPTQDPKS